MNILFKGRVLETPLSYNAMTACFIQRSHLDRKSIWNCYGKPDFEEVLSNPHIVHFSREIKPWHKRCTHPWSKYYWHYLKETPWKHLKSKKYQPAGNHSFITKLFEIIKTHIKETRYLRASALFLRPLLERIFYKIKYLLQIILGKLIQKRANKLLKIVLENNKLELEDNVSPLRRFKLKKPVIGFAFPRKAHAFYFEEILNCQFVDNINDASVAFIWGISCGWRKYQFLKKVVKRAIPIVIVEDGLIRSCKIGNVPGLSIIFDHAGVYYNDSIGSVIDKFLEQKWKITKEQKIQSKRAIDFIISNHLSKYNLVQPEIVNFNVNHKYKSVSLVLDQRKGDASIAGARASGKSFKKMLKDAIKENPHGLILVKIHPDAIMLSRYTGYFTHLISKNLGNNVRIITRNINPISLIMAVDKVYTVSSGMGFEALMCEKKVYCYGHSFYSGRGLTVDRVVDKGKVLKKRTVEEIFYAAYIKYTHYFNPNKFIPCDIFETMKCILEERGIPYLNDNHILIPDPSLSIESS